MRSDIFKDVDPCQVNTVLRGVHSRFKALVPRVTMIRPVCSLVQKSYYTELAINRIKTCQ